MISARHAGITPPKSLQRSLTVSILWVHLSVLTIALAAGFFVLLGISRNQTIRQGENSLAYMAYQMDTLSDGLYDIRSQLMQDKDVQIYLASDRSVDAEDILLQQSVMNQLSLIIRSYSYVSSITLFQGDGPALCVNETMQIQGKAEDEPLPIQSSDAWKGLTAHSGLTWGGQYQEMELFLSRYRPGNSSTVVSLLLPLVDYQGGRPFSVLSVNVPTEYFSFLYSKHADYGAAVRLWDEDGSLLLSVPESSGAPEGFHLFRDAVVTSQLSRTGWHLSEGSPFSVR